MADRNITAAAIVAATVGAVCLSERISSPNSVTGIVSAECTMASKTRNLTGPDAVGTCAAVCSAAPVVTGQNATIARAFNSVASLYGVCPETESETMRAAILMAMNTGLQELFQYDRALRELTLRASVIYQSFIPENASDIPQQGDELPSIFNLDAHECLCVLNVQYSCNESGKWLNVPLRAANPGNDNQHYSASGVEAFRGRQGWLDETIDLETGLSGSSIPVWYETVRRVGSARRPMVRIYPPPPALPVESLPLMWQIDVEYIPAPPPVTYSDILSGKAFPMAHPFVESYLMPLIRHAALTSSYFDYGAGEGLVQSVKEAYEKAKSFLLDSAVTPKES